jgi:hypothetical protein
MLSGKLVRLRTAIVALETSDGKRIAVTVPVGGIIEIIRGPLPEGTWLVDVRWDGRLLEMFAEDVKDCGEEITDRVAGA